MSDLATAIEQINDVSDLPHAAQAIYDAASAFRDKVSKMREAADGDDPNYLWLDETFHKAEAVAGDAAGLSILADKLK